MGEPDVQVIQDAPGVADQPLVVVEVDPGQEKVDISLLRFHCREGVRLARLFIHKPEPSSQFAVLADKVLVPWAELEELGQGDEHLLGQAFRPRLFQDNPVHDLKIALVILGLVDHGQSFQGRQIEWLGAEDDAQKPDGLVFLLLLDHAGDQGIE